MDIFGCKPVAASFQLAAHASPLRGPICPGQSCGVCLENPRQIPWSSPGAGLRPAGTFGQLCCSMVSSSSVHRHGLLQISWGQQVHFLLHLKCCRFTTMSTFLAFLGKYESAGLPFLPHCGAVGNSCYVSAQMLRFRGKRCDSCIHLLSQFVKHLSAFHPEVS